MVDSKSMFKLNYRAVSLTVVFFATTMIAGCSDGWKCWPFCSSKTSSGVASTTDTTTTTDTTSSTSTTCNDGSTPTSSITSLRVIKPNGGESYPYLDGVGYKGSNTIEIEWIASGSGGIVIELYKAGALKYQIQGQCEEYKQTTGNIKWTPHNALPAGSDYQIKIMAPNDSTINDLSDSYFSITAPVVEE